jgi:hypothetical protein
MDPHRCRGPVLVADHTPGVLGWASRPRRPQVEMLIAGVPHRMIAGTVCSDRPRPRCRLRPTVASPDRIEWPPCCLPCCKSPPLPAPPPPGVQTCVRRRFEPRASGVRNYTVVRMAAVDDVLVPAGGLTARCGMERYRAGRWEGAASRPWSWVWSEAENWCLPRVDRLRPGGHEAWHPGGQPVERSAQCLDHRADRSPARAPA